MKHGMNEERIFAPWILSISRAKQAKPLPHGVKVWGYNLQLIGLKSTFFVVASSVSLFGTEKHIKAPGGMDDAQTGKNFIFHPYFRR